MTAFWRAGPLVVTSDPLGGPSSATQKIGIPLAAPAASASGQGATYNWLQPSWVTVEVDTPAADGSGAVLKTTTMTTKFQGVGVAPFAASGGDASTMQLAPGPYTAVKGYVQFLKSLAG